MELRELPPFTFVSPSMKMNSREAVALIGLADKFSGPSVGFNVYAAGCSAHSGTLKPDEFEQLFGITLEQGERLYEAMYSDG